MPLFAAILRIPFSVIAPIILVLCAIGAYTVHNNTFDVVMMLVFGVVGYFMKKANYPLAPLVLAIVLGDKAEVSLRQALLGSQGNLGVFFSNGLVATVMTLGLIALFWPIIQRLTRCAWRARPAHEIAGPPPHAREGSSGSDRGMAAMYKPLRRWRFWHIVYQP